ncbi:MAG: hypothetical protein HEQ21_01660 [Blastomonas sp.]|nr:hypothetical protein [Blastomonas sp.]MCO5791503.1 hypothetical protein [Blastomonas sp.]
MAVFGAHLGEVLGAEHRRGDQHQPPDLPGALGSQLAGDHRSGVIAHQVDRAVSDDRLDSRDQRICIIGDRGRARRGIGHAEARRVERHHMPPADRGQRPHETLEGAPGHRAHMEAGKARMGRIGLSCLADMDLAERAVDIAAAHGCR